jgi:hypothetical protein
MSYAKSRFIKRTAERCPRSDARYIPKNTRGIYTLLKKIGNNTFKVVYIGMSGGSKALGIYFRINRHKNSKRMNRSKWDYFSIFEVWDNITQNEVKELEGLILHIYRKDADVNKLNRQRRFLPLLSKEVRNMDLRTWNK